MLRSFVSLLSLLLIIGFSSCEKEGLTGPEGPEGPEGPTGARGATGEIAVQTFMFDDDTLLAPTYYKFYELPGVTNGQVDSSVVLIYYKDVLGVWNQAGALTFERTYSTRWYYVPGLFGGNTGAFYLDAESPDGNAEYPGPEIVLSKVKIVLVPLSDIDGKKEPVDYRNYSATMRYYGIAE